MAVLEFETGVNSSSFPSAAVILATLGEENLERFNHLQLHHTWISGLCREATGERLHCLTACWPISRLPHLKLFYTVLSASKLNLSKCVYTLQENLQHRWLTGVAKRLSVLLKSDKVPEKPPKKKHGWTVSASSETPFFPFPVCSVPLIFPVLSPVSLAPSSVGLTQQLMSTSAHLSPDWMVFHPPAQIHI